jgi:signal transduction histidine kinase
MNLATLATYAPIYATAGYTVVLLVLFIRNRALEVQIRWFLGFLAISALWNLALFFYLSAGVLPNLFLLLMLAGNLILGITTSYYVAWSNQRRWLAFSGVALLALVLLELFLPQAIGDEPLIFVIQPSWAGLLGMGLWLLMATTLLRRTWLSYRATRLPGHANRLLHWVVSLLATFLGEAMIMVDEPRVLLSGLVICFIGILGLSRALYSHRLFDVQARLRRLVVYAIIVAATLLPAGLLLWGLIRLASGRNLSSLSSVFLFLTVVTVGFLLYQPYLRLVNNLISRLFKGRKLATAQIIRSYSQAISRTLDVEQLAHVIIDTISGQLDTTRGALMLVSYANHAYAIEPIPTLGSLSHQKMTFPTGASLMYLLAHEHNPLLQYDVDFNPDYAVLSNEERDWLAAQGLEVYVPIIADENENPDGLIALGPKRSGRAYQPDELELVQMLADQTVVALQNARLYSALNHQNEQIIKLNKDLLRQNERLEILDQVKADFITIASHELRTPLTQVIGYADILQDMNEQQELTREQIREMMSAINRASARLEKLISAMLDASQLEVSGMALDFTQTKLEKVVHLAVEPLMAAMQERNLKFEISGLAELPLLQSDFNRLVQAISNLIGNAVKYTPDFGSISITAATVPSHDEGAEYVELIVTDTGIGIDAEYQELIFEKFFRIGDPELHSTGSTKFKGAGPGLGLHIAKGVIEAHGGRIWVESYGYDEALLPGSRFHIILPVIPPNAQQSLAALESAIALIEQNGRTSQPAPVAALDG